MIKKLQAKHQYFAQKFLIGWLLFTLIFLIILSLYQWQRLRSEKTGELELKATRFAFRIETLIENVMQSTNVLSLYVESQPSCQQLLPRMQSIILNNWFIAGLLVDDPTHNLHCSTLAFTEHSLPAITPNTFFQGPIKLSENDQEFYLLNQSFNNTRIRAFLLKSLLETLCRNSGSEFDSIGLYDKERHQMIFSFGEKFSDEDVLNDTNLTSISINQDEGIVTLPLENLKNITLIVSIDSLDFLHAWLMNLVLLLPPFLLLAVLFYFYTKRLIRKRFSMEKALQRALKDGEFRPYYQGIRDEKENAYCGAEVLIRWQTRFNEMIMPDYFIEEAEQSGLIVPITLHLMDVAFAECKSLLANQHFHLAFNLSPIHFRDKHFFTQFHALCTYHRVSPTQLMLELTERELFSQSEEQVVLQMKQLREQGFSLAIDDFGTGQSNLNYLHHFPFNYLKIDKLFINTIGTGAIIERLNTSIIQMAQSLQLNIIAEGVENKVQRDFLVTQQVRYIQGWYYTKALPYKDFVLLFKEKIND